MEVKHCSIAECEKPRSGRSRYCGMHQARIQRHGDPNTRKPNATPRPIEDVLKEYIPHRPAGSCWIWRGHQDRSGYGRVNRGSKVVFAHRLSYEHFVGPIPTGLIIRHHCDNPPCVNPAHLVPGTDADNIQDAVDRRRHAFGERSGHAKLTESQVIEARRLYATGKYGKAELAAMYGLTPAPMYLLLQGKTWRHLPGAISEQGGLPQGQRHHATKLQDSDVLKIRERYAAGECSQGELAKEYGLTATPMSQLLRGVTWKHLPLTPKGESK